MRLLSQKIGKRANEDDKEVGEFRQARYRALRLLDEIAILACAAYVDLNPIRATMAQTIETSEFTSVQQRAISLQAEVKEQATANVVGVQWSQKRLLNHLVHSRLTSSRARSKRVVMQQVVERATKAFCR